ncbi:MAG: hypothetical protein PHH48_05060 [Eubacteriales bacterium]|nr:hypothetical protein [Eubacteriales bacterium]
MRIDILNELTKYDTEDLNMINKSEIARRFNCDVRTVGKYMDKIMNPNTKVASNRIYTTKLDGFEEIINMKIDKFGANGKSIFYFLTKNKGYTGGYTTVANYVRTHKIQEQHKATVRFETVPGFQAQVDWKEEIVYDNMRNVVSKFIGRNEKEV